MFQVSSTYDLETKILTDKYYSIRLKLGIDLYYFWTENTDFNYQSISVF